MTTKLVEDKKEINNFFNYWFKAAGRPEGRCSRSLPISALE